MNNSFKSTKILYIQCNKLSGIDKSNIYSLHFHVQYVLFTNTIQPISTYNSLLYHRRNIINKMLNPMQIHLTHQYTDIFVFYLHIEKHIHFSVT